MIKGFVLQDSPYIAIVKVKDGRSVEEIWNIDEPSDIEQVKAHYNRKYDSGVKWEVAGIFKRV